MKKQIFDSLNEVIEAFGEDGLVVITYLPQVIYYISNYNIQPVWTAPSEVDKWKVAFYFIKAETKKPYEGWQKRKVEREREFLNNEKFSTRNHICNESAVSKRK